MLVKFRLDPGLRHVQVRCRSGNLDYRGRRPTKCRGIAASLPLGLKNGLASTHPIRGPELRALRELRRTYPESPYLFVSERGGPMTPATVRKLIARAGELAKLPFPIHPHMLRHSAGYKLANEGHDTRSIQQYLGHRNITHTVRYTELSPERFKNFWKD